MIPNLTTMSLSEIARLIRANWPKPYFGAVPYLSAMATLNSVNDTYGCDDGRSVVAYALANMAQFRGEVAREVKKELNRRLK